MHACIYSDNWLNEWIKRSSDRDRLIPSKHELIHMHILTQLNENEARNSIEQSICRDLLIPSNVHVCIYRFLIRNSSIFKQANLVHSKRSSLKKKTRSSAPPPPPGGTACTGISPGGGGGWGIRRERGGEHPAPPHHRPIRQCKPSFSIRARAPPRAWFSFRRTN